MTRVSVMTMIHEMSFLFRHQVINERLICQSRTEDFTLGLWYFANIANNLISPFDFIGVYATPYWHVFILTFN